MSHQVRQSRKGAEVRNSRHKTKVPYKTWPVYTVAFLKTLYQAIYGLALPNYLIYNNIIDAELIGVIVSMTSLAYIVTPFIGQKMANWIGYKNCLIISLVLSSFVYTMQIVVFTPSIFIFMQLLEGLSLGLFWPNIMMQVSIWQKYSSNRQNDHNFSQFNKSWNFGILGGYVIGFLIVNQSGSEYFALVISVAITFALIPIGFFIDSAKKIKALSSDSLPSANNQDDAEVMISPGESLSKISRPEELVGAQQTESRRYQHLVIPAFIAWALNLAYSISKSVFSFNLPFNLKNAGFASEWRYLVVFAQQFLQIVGLNLIGPIPVSKKVKIVKTCLFSQLLLFVGMIFIPNIYFIAISTVLVGLSIGLQQGLVMKVNFDHSAHTNNSKYINIGEIIAGFGFGTTPLWLGLLIENASYRWSYIILTVVSAVMALFYWIVLRKTFFISRKSE